MPRFGDGDVRELLGLRLPHEIINPATVYEAEAGVAFGVDAFRIERGSMGALHDARDIAGELLRTVRD